MSDPSLPPGVTSSMIPGNRPIDRAYDKFIQDEEKMFKIYEDHYGVEPADGDEILDKLDIDEQFKEKVDEIFEKDYYNPGVVTISNKIYDQNGDLYDVKINKIDMTDWNRDKRLAFHWFREGIKQERESALIKEILDEFKEVWKEEFNIYDRRE